ncbi:hypothetical protein Tco_0405353 [Tanacetum coccineum]
MSKLDRFLMTNGFLSAFPHISALCLDRHLLDHRLILLKEIISDYGSTPFRFYHSWLELPGFDDMISKDLEASKLIHYKQLHDIQSSKHRDLIQKAKIRWAIEGDENSKYFHAIINKKRINLSVKGIRVLEMEAPVSNDEIRTAVWGCGVDKSPGPDGFTFDFFRSSDHIWGLTFYIASVGFSNMWKFATGLIPLCGLEFPNV